MTCYFVAYWVREGGWVPRESLIKVHPLEWLVQRKRDTLNHVRLASWQEIDEPTYLRWHRELAEVDDELKEPTQTRLAPLKWKPDS